MIKAKNAAKKDELDHVFVLKQSKWNEKILMSYDVKSYEKKTKGIINIRQKYLKGKSSIATKER
jgi:hypothetical protein